MKILFNCSVNVVGGAVQNSANFVKYALLNEVHQFLFVVSYAVKDVLKGWGISDERIYTVSSPARCGVARRTILSLECEFIPDVVYTMAGPTYVKFKSLHVMGISDPYITHADKLAFRLNRSFNAALSFAIKELLKGIYARYSADYFLFQTETSRNGFCKRFGWSNAKTEILQNAVGEDFFSRAVTNASKEQELYRIFVPSAYYPHKNLEIIFDICQLFTSYKERGSIIFVTTAPPDSRFALTIEKLHLHGMVKNHGPYAYNDAHELYATADAVFIPSILETFSTSYLEAIAMAKPLIVADRPFSREVCGKYANYYSHLSAFAAMNAIFEALESPIDADERERITSRYGSQAQRVEKTISILEKLYRKAG